MAFNLHTPHDLLMQIALRAREKRLALNLTQSSLSKSSGVSFSVIKKFESTGKISIESLLKIALILDSLNEFNELFSAKSMVEYTTLDQLLKIKPRKRGRK
jgi:transcriptional regulator with XRE-family HTH domain